MTLHLDTHVAVWLRMGDTRRLKPIRRLLSRGPLRLSPFAVLELQLLYEIGRLREAAPLLVEQLRLDHGVEVEAQGPAGAALRALDGGFTRDPFDRLISAHALALGASLLTADAHLLRHVSCARWS